MSRDVPESHRKPRKPLTPAQVRLYLAGYLALAAGSLGSVWAYRRAAQDVVGGAVIVSAYDTKKYQDQLERYGGKANILATEMQEWFVGLWHGRHLAYTLAVLTFAVALACFYVALFLPDLPPFGEDPDRGPDAPRK